MCCIRIHAVLKCLAKVIYPFGTDHQLASQMKWQLHEDNHPPGSCAAQQATCGKCKSKPQTFAENTQKCATSVVPAPSSPHPWWIYLVQLFRVIASDQKQDIRADILRHCVVVAHNLAVVHQEFGVGHEFGDAQHSRGSLSTKNKVETL